MAAVAIAVTTSVSSSSSSSSSFSSLRRVVRIRESSFCPPLQFLSSSSSPCLRFSAIQWRKRHGGDVLVACLPSSTPKSNTTAPSTKLYVSGLSFRTTEESLRNAFQNFGQLVEVNLIMDRIANRPRGFAFLRYATEDESKQAIEGMHGKFLDGRVIFVEYAKPRSELRQSFKQSPRQY